MCYLYGSLGCNLCVFVDLFMYFTNLFHIFFCEVKRDGETAKEGNITRLLFSFVRCSNICFGFLFFSVLSAFFNLIAFFVCWFERRHRILSQTICYLNWSQCKCIRYYSWVSRRRNKNSNRIELKYLFCIFHKKIINLV